MCTMEKASITINKLVQDGRLGVCTLQTSLRCLHKRLHTALAHAHGRTSVRMGAHTARRAVATAAC